jgi:hypothetical protein
VPDDAIPRHRHCVVDGYAFGAMLCEEAKWRGEGTGRPLVRVDWTRGEMIPPSASGAMLLGTGMA